MQTYYQVCAQYALQKSIPQLIGTSLSSIYAPCTTIPIFPYYNTYLITSRIFPTLYHAKSYIAYLHGVYPRNPEQPPILDGNQKELFSGGQNEN